MNHEKHEKHEKGLALGGCVRRSALRGINRERGKRLITVGIDPAESVPDFFTPGY